MPRCSRARVSNGFIPKLRRWQVDEHQLVFGLTDFGDGDDPVVPLVAEGEAGRLGGRARTSQRSRIKVVRLLGGEVGG